LLLEKKKKEEEERRTRTRRDSFSTDHGSLCYPFRLNTMNTAHFGIEAEDGSVLHLK
jgi:hypothetical protein